MELKYVVLTIIKILISVPTLVLYHTAEGANLLGGHLDNKNISLQTTENAILNGTNNTNLTVTLQGSNNNTQQNSEEIPNPSPLVLPGYNLPENIFNKGKPFYLEKDPLTGKIDFNAKTSSERLDDQFYDYIEDEPSTNIYAKSNIDRKDGALSSHKPSDINQLTPNFHDFLNLPVKYNSDKYVYPLISSSYANTKIQGNTNKYHNHKDYNAKTSPQKPTVSPTYYSSVMTTYQKPSVPTTTTTLKTTATTTTTTSAKPPSFLEHPNFHEDFEYYDYTDKPSKVNDIYLTTKNIEHVYLTTQKPPTTTRRVMSLFEQLFGDYDETVATTERTKPPPLFQNLPNNKKKDDKISQNKFGVEIKPEKPYTPINSHSIPIGLDKDFEAEGGKFTTITSTSTTEVAKVNHTKYDYEDEIAEEIEYEEESEEIKPENNTEKTISTTESTTIKVTSLPLGENHVNSLNNQQPIIVATQNIREQLNNEKVNGQPPSTSNIHIAPDQDTVSFVVGHHQSVAETTLKESPYESNPFRPFYGQQTPRPELSTAVSTAVTIQPQINSEASLSIGVPINVPGQVVDDIVPTNNVKFETEPGQKIVFPDDKEDTTNLVPPPPPSPPRQVLQLNSKPMYHQLPSDLTPPKEKPPILPPARLDSGSPRPPWDPRPGHFHSGKPEYVRPPRPPPHNNIAYKRIDNLPNILPQFRPNMNNAPPPPPPSYYLNRQPLLDRPSNRPIGFFENLQPPPPPLPPKYLHNLRKISPPPPIDNRLGPSVTDAPLKEDYMYKTPPQVVIAHRRIGNIEGDVETLQMIQAKKTDKKEIIGTSESITETVVKDGTEKPLYVVYPVNTPPIKMDVIENNKKETVVIGTRAESPLPPSKIQQQQQQDFNYQQLANRNDSPILKPHYRPPTFPIKSDFPYPLERPDPAVLNPAVPETPSNSNGNNLEETNNGEADFLGSNHWNTIGSGDNLESRIVVGPKSPPNQISVTLKTYSEKPIAVAYTPTEPHHHSYDIDNKYSMPNYANPVIPEIRPGSVADAPIKSDNNNEFTVSAVMHTHPQVDYQQHQQHNKHLDDQHNKHLEDRQDIYKYNHKTDIDNPNIHEDFQAPFQASISIDSVNEGWSVVKDRNKSSISEEAEVTTIPLATTSEFDIENFKPQLEGGFKPIYNFPEDSSSSKEPTVEDDSLISEREE